MAKFDKLDAVAQSYMAATEELKREIESFKNDDVFAENENLRAQNNKHIGDIASIGERNKELILENKRLKNQMFEQCFNEKTKMISTADEALNAYFGASSQQDKNRLSQLEDDIKAKIDMLGKQSEQLEESFKSSVYPRLFELREHINNSFAEMYRNREESERRILSEKSGGIEKLKAESLTEEEIARRGKQNNLEVLFGLNILNRLGVFLVLVGLTAAVQFTYTRVPDIAKGILVYLFGVFVLGLGEFFGRKKPNVFSIGITSGGVAILYIATALCFFMLNVIGMYTALLLCILVTAASFLLSRRYNSQTIAAFAIIGGYLPIASIAGNETMIYFAMVYFIILNIFSLSVAIIKKWNVAQFIGFVLNAVAACTVVLQLYDTNNTHFAGFVGLVYVFFAFAVYNAIPLISTYRTKTRLSVADNVMLVLNAVFGAAAIFASISLFRLGDISGIVSIILALYYLAAAKLLELKLRDEKSCHVLFYITGLMFAVLVIPLQFGVAYLSLGWLIEGVLLFSYGMLKEHRIFRTSGIVICGLCLFSFVTMDILFNIHNSRVFFFRYMFITLGSIVPLAAMLYKKTARRTAAEIYKCAVIINLWGFLMYTVFEGIGHYFQYSSIHYHRAVLYFLHAAGSVISFAYAYAISRLKFITDKPLRVIAMIINVAAIIDIIGINTTREFYIGILNPGLTIAGTVIMVVINLLAVAVVYDLATRLALGRRLGVEWIPICVSAFFVFLLAQNLTVSLNLSLNSLIITGILALTALGWIIFGFIRRYHYIRLFGLVLSFVVTAKLFLFDLANLSAGLRIVSYFMMGVSFLAISFVYQHFSKRLERVAQGGGENNE